MHYEDGSSERIPVIYGKDMADLWMHTQSGEQLRGVEHVAWEHRFRAWNGEGTLALTRQTWTNRHPYKVITHLDFESMGKEAAPFLVGITVE